MQFLNYPIFINQFLYMIKGKAVLLILKNNNSKKNPSHIKMSSDAGFLWLLECWTTEVFRSYFWYICLSINASHWADISNISSGAYYCLICLLYFLCVPVAVVYRIPLCALINQHMSGLARKFRDVKFIKAISTTCIPNYPDKNLPTIFVYLEGDIKAQFIGPLVFGGMNLTRDGEYLHLWSSKWKAKLLCCQWEKWGLGEEGRY